jgi:PhzF family phenazine biosynthesis protein
VRTRIFVVDAFTTEAFRGNPAGVCLLNQPADDDWMQSVAAEMRHAETAFVRFTGEHHELRWFTPGCEVDLCGHATLAAAHVLWEQDLHSKWLPIQFHTRSGILPAMKRGDDGVLNFPSEPADAEPISPIITEILGGAPTWFGRNRMDWIAELPDESAVVNLRPNLALIRELGLRGLMVTARADRDVDFVSRFFGPSVGIDEDSVTGSAHCCLAPYWSERLGKNQLVGYQASARGGTVKVDHLGDRVELSGRAVTVLEGHLTC